MPTMWDDKALTPTSLQLDNRVFVVTGGARGLGLVLAEALVEAGGHGELSFAFPFQLPTSPQHCMDLTNDLR